MIARRRIHRTTFLAAGVYNIAWGIYSIDSIVDPQWLFTFAEMPLQNYPQIFACLGMVIGLYGVLYLRVAKNPETGFSIAAVGSAGKILGPIGLWQLIWSGAWPIKTAVLCITNDLIWWIPFGLYLHDAWQLRSARSDDSEEIRPTKPRAAPPS
jgi:hypothetical protein